MTHYNKHNYTRVCYMHVQEYINYLNLHKNTKQLISVGKFKKLFIVGDVGDDGNCLFYSVEYLTTYKADDLRSKVCDFYKKFDTSKEYPEGSLNAMIKFNLEYDNDDADGSLHSKNICKNLKWGAVMDVAALAEILKMNILLLNYAADPKARGYTMQEFIYKPNVDTICIKFNGRNHFQPLMPQFSASSLAKESASPSPIKRDYLAEAKNVSPDMLIEIEKSGRKINDKPVTTPKKKTSVFKSINRFFGRGKGKITRRKIFI